MNRSAKVVLLAVIAFLATAVYAQRGTRGTELRTVHGAVLDRQEVPINSAIVYLKNERTQDIRTHITGKDGQYRFSGLDPNINYQLHAEHDGMTSSAREVSSFDTRKDIVIMLKVDHKKRGE